MTVSMLALLGEFLVKSLLIIEPQFSHPFRDDGNGELLCRVQWEPAANDLEEQHVTLKVGWQSQKMAKLMDVNRT